MQGQLMGGVINSILRHWESQEISGYNFLLVMPTRPQPHLRKEIIRLWEVCGKWSTKFWKFLIIAKTFQSVIGVKKRFSISSNPEPVFYFFDSWGVGSMTENETINEEIFSHFKLKSVGLIF